MSVYVSAVNRLSFRLFILSFTFFKLITRAREHWLDSCPKRCSDSRFSVVVVVVISYCTMTRFTTLFHFFATLISMCCIRVSHDTKFHLSLGVKQRKRTTLHKTDKTKRCVDINFRQTNYKRWKIKIRENGKSMSPNGFVSYVRWHYGFNANLFEWRLAKLSISTNKKKNTNRNDDN